VKQTREFVKPIDRLANDRVEKKQNSLEGFNLQPESFCGDNNRLAGVVERNLLGQIATDAERAFQYAAELAHVVLECGTFKPPQQFAGDREKSVSYFAGYGFEIDKNQRALLRRGRKEQVDQVITIRLTGDCPAGEGRICKFAKNGWRSGRIGRQNRCAGSPRF